MCVRACVRACMCACMCVIKVLTIIIIDTNSEKGPIHVQSVRIYSTDYILPAKERNVAHLRQQYHQ